MKQASSAAQKRLPARRSELQGEQEEDEVRDLVKELVGRIGHSEGPALEGSDKEDVILDVEVDGVRCVLVRQTPETDRVEVVLSPREREIARMVAKGYPNKVIARVLEISSWTVSTHLRRVFAKLGVSSRAAMVAHLLEEGQLGNGPRNGH